MTDPSAPVTPEKSPTTPAERHPILEAFNAEGVVEHPDQPPASEPHTPAGDADAPPPG